MTSPSPAPSSPSAPPPLRGATLATLWAGLALTSSMTLMVSGQSVALSLVDVIASTAFWAALGMALGAVARRRAAARLDARPAFAWALAAAMWAGLEACFTVIVVVKPTRWPPLPYSLVGIVLPWLIGAVTVLWALRRASQQRTARGWSPAVVIVAVWSTLAVLTPWLPRWLRAITDAPAWGWFGWGLLDVAWMLTVAASTTCFALALLAPRAPRWRRPAIATVLAALALVPLATARGTSTSPARADAPDLVWIMIDSARADHLDAYGYARPTMPTLTALAQRGTLVRGHVSAGGRTESTYAKMLPLNEQLDGYVRAAPVPLSAVRDLLPTGWLPTQGGALATLSRAGYELALIHPYHDLLEDRGLQPWLQAFDHAEQTRRSGDASLGAYVARMLLGDRLDGVPRMDRWAAFRRRYLAEQTDEAAVAYLGQRSRRPLFLIVHLAGGHFPYYTFETTPQLAGPPQADAEVERYDQALRASDDQLATILGAVERTLHDPQIFVFADHGSHLPGQPTLPGAVTVPLVVSPPLPATPTQVTTSQDIVATTLALATGTAPRCEARLARDLRCPADDRARVVDHTGHGRLILATMRGSNVVAVDVQRQSLRAGQSDGAALEPCPALRAMETTGPDLVASPLEQREGLSSRLDRRLADCASTP